MQQSFTPENMTKPFMEMMKLNMETLNHLTQNRACLDELLQAKEPKDLLLEQMRLLNDAGLEMSKYCQSASSIWLKAITQNSNEFAENMTNAAMQAQQNVKKATGSKKGKL